MSDHNEQDAITQKQAFVLEITDDKALSLFKDKNLMHILTFLRSTTYMTLNDIEEEFRRVLGVTNIIWLKNGLVEDPKGYFRRIVGNYIGCGTGGHTDEFVRFANPNTIMLAWVNEEERFENTIFIYRINYLLK